MKEIKIENILYLFQLMVLNIVFFNRIVNKWNGLPNHIRKSNSIATNSSVSLFACNVVE